VVFPNGLSCRELRETNRANFLSIQNLEDSSPVLAEILPGESVLTMLKACAKCHSGPAPKAPPISFDNPTVLAAELKVEGYPRGTLLEEIKYRVSEDALPRDRMPEGFHLAPHQSRILIDYLNSIPLQFGHTQP
ncbi:MAG: hypothetical protein ABL958_13070, partial [Bdellovibrionia bacterium]